MSPTRPCRRAPLIGGRVGRISYSKEQETGMLDSHPAGPERVAGWDQAVAKIRATNGRLPQRA